ITEGVIARDPVETAITLKELRELGIKLTIDDFGTGYSSLKHLSEFSLDALKIDKDFTADICSKDKHSTAVADAILAIAQQLGLEVIAEGVETQSTLDYLHSRNCKAAQGYLFSKPLDATHCAKFIQANRASKNAQRLHRANAS
ncbi:MAG: EAL domain-containing protein, partial [Granulosicoccaceae bacterium]